MTIPTWAGPAVSPLWGIGDALSLDIAAGADWQVPFKVFATDGVTPLDVAAPVLEMRRDRTSQSQLMAHLDTTGDSTGLIHIVGIGSWLLSMSAEVTSALPTGRGFWDCFGQVNGHTTAIASGIVVVRPKVTVSTVPWTPSAPVTPPVTVDTTPTPINLTFPAGDDLVLDLALREREDGSTPDLTGASASAAVTTSTGDLLAAFTVTVDPAGVLHLHLGAALTALLPATARWKCVLVTATETETVAAGSVRVTR